MSSQIRKTCKNPEKKLKKALFSSQGGKYYTQNKEVCNPKNLSIPKILSSPRKQAHFAPDILMCVSSMCGLLEAILARLVIRHSASLKLEHFCGYKAVQLHLSAPFVYTFLLIITSVSLWLKTLALESKLSRKNG